MEKETKILLGLLLIGGVYFFYKKNKVEQIYIKEDVKNDIITPQYKNVQNSVVSPSNKNACGQTIPTVIPCYKDLDKDGKCYDSKGQVVDVSKMPYGFSCYNKNGTSRNVNNIPV
jgi:protein involved in sex pheromone biosynthesis